MALAAKKETRDYFLLAGRKPACTLRCIEVYRIPLRNFISIASWSTELRVRLTANFGDVIAPVSADREGNLHRPKNSNFSRNNKGKAVHTLARDVRIPSSLSPQKRIPIVVNRCGRD